MVIITLCSDLYGKSPEFKALILTERGGDHENFVAAALIWLKGYAAEKNFEIDVINHASEINEALLSQYRLIIQLNYPPYTWDEEAIAAFIKYIDLAEPL